MALKRTPSIEIKLAPSDWMQFDLACRLNGKTRGEMARFAIQHFLASQNNEATEAKESPLEQRLKRIEDRLAALTAKSTFDTNKRLDVLTDRLTRFAVRTALDIGMVYMMMFKLMNKETRNQTVEWAAVGSFERLQQKLKHPEANVHQAMHWLEEPESASA